MRRSGTMSTSAWAATPRVAVPASSQIIGPVHSLTGICLPKAKRKTTRPAMATRLATAGAHMYAAKWPRAFSTCPSRVYTP